FEASNQFYAGFERHFGSLFSASYIFHGMTKPSQYFKQERPQNFQFGPSKLKFMFVYPFAKTSEWYQEPKEKRDELMREHRAVASKFEKIFTNTVYSFGLGDHEHLLAFETDYPKDFVELLQALRETKARPYTKYDVPIIPCLNKPEKEIINEIFIT
ncbi:MAG: chlorite dismutase family protein, partial [Planctomycetes bacterium]|nr:chlorite dismutase family protein [Planctomycetota bacterium]